MTQQNRGIALVVLADVVLAYAYTFAAHGFIGGIEGPRAPATYWLTQLWVYLLIAPVAAVASWRGARQVLDAWAGRPRWWRLTAEGAAAGAGCSVLMLLSLGSWPDFAMALRDAVALCGGLGLVLTCANLPLARLLRPHAASGNGDAPHARGLTPGAG